MNYTNIIQLFEQFADKHLMVQRFKSDSYDKLSDFSNESESFPILYVIPQLSTPVKTVNGYNLIRSTFQVYCLVPRIDLIPTEDDVILLNQTNNNINICTKIITDLYYSLDRLDEIDIVGDVNVTVANNVGTDYLQGVQGLFTFELPNTDICELPMMSDLVIFDFDCDNIPPQPFNVVRIGVNGIEFKDVKAGEEIDIKIVDENNNELTVDSFDLDRDTVKVINNVHPIQILNSVDDELAVISSGDEYYNVENTTATLNVTYESGGIVNQSPIELYSGVDNGEKNVIIPNFVRPQWWAPRPEGWENKYGVYWLCEVMEGIDSQFFFRDNYNSSKVYIDDVYLQDIPDTGSYITINGSDYGFYHMGRKFVWLFFETIGIPYINLANNDYSFNPYGIKGIRVIEELINLTDLTIYNSTDAGFSYGLKTIVNTQNIWFNPNLNLITGQGLFMNRKLINVENLPILRGVLGETFRDSGVNFESLDLNEVTNLGYCWYSSNNRINETVNLINTVNINAMYAVCQGNYFLKGFIMDDCSNITNADGGWYNCFGLEKIILTNIKCNIDLTNTFYLTKNGLIELINSIADLTNLTSSHITLTGNPNVDADVIALANSKNWTIIV